MSPSTRYAAQGLGSILDIAEARVREVDAELDRAEALVFCATEGARLAPPHDLTPTAVAATRETGGSADPSGEGGAGNTLTVTLGYLGFVLALGVCIGLGLGLAVFVASQIVIGWFGGVR